MRMILQTNYDKDGFGADEVVFAFPEMVILLYPLQMRLGMFQIRLRRLGLGV